MAFRPFFVLITVQLTGLLRAQVPSEVIPLTATTTVDPPAITLHWPSDPAVTGYSLYYRSPDEGSWILGLELPGSATSFIDQGVSIGEVWEYMLVAGKAYPYERTVCVPVGQQVTFTIRDEMMDGLCCTFGDGSWSVWACGEQQAHGAAFTTTDAATFTVCGISGCSDVTVHIEPDVFVDPLEWELVNAAGTVLASDHDMPAPRFGVITAGIEVPADEHPGAVLLVVENTVAAALPDELARLRTDLQEEGWQTARIDVSGSSSPQEVKQAILQAQQAMPDLKALFLLGEVPVPYAGKVAPDGHLPDHLGAWPADLYYGELNGDWTDATLTATMASSSSNHNVPGDGKFDQSILPDDVDLMVGRVDLFGLPSFPVDGIELTRRYLDRSHAFRKGIIPYERRAWVDENFPEYEFDCVIHRSCIPMFGADRVAHGDFVTSQLAAAPVWLMGGGGGSHTGANGVATTQELAGTWLNGIFGHLFGSYFGDWDRTDNFLRATVAAGMLGSVWGGQELNFHNMALNAPIGSAVRRSQNASYRTAGRQGRGIHVALMGDPTLRPFPIAPVTGLQTVAVDWGTELQWDVHPLADRGYAVYRRAGADQAFERLPNGLTASNSFFDPAPLAGASEYMVRPMDLDTSASGTFVRMGPGSTLASWSTGLATVDPSIADLQVAPLPSTGTFTVRSRSDRTIRSLKLLDLGGRPVAARAEVRGASGTVSTDAAAGWYVLQVDVADRMVRTPVIIAR